MTLRALIFDVDGTLADTENAHRAAFNQAFAEVGLDWQWDQPLYKRLLEISGGKERITHYWKQVRGDVVDINGSALTETVQRIHELKTAAYERRVQQGGVQLRPGVLALIEAAAAAGLRLAIATTTSPENVATLLEVGLGKDWARYFAASGCGDIVPHKKPAPDIYFWVLEKLGLPASDCIALEDSENGLRASLAAGIKTFVTTNYYTRNHDFSGAAGMFDDLGDLKNFYRITGLPLPKSQLSV